MQPTPLRAPHWLRFARAVALASIASSAGAGCRAITAPLACEHCRCGGPISLSTPVECRTIDHDECCMTIEGPLPPPDLA